MNNSNATVPTIEFETEDFWHTIFTLLRKYSTTKCYKVNGRYEALHVSNYGNHSVLLDSIRVINQELNVKTYTVLDNREISFFYLDGNLGSLLLSHAAQEELMKEIVDSL